MIKCNNDDKKERGRYSLIQYDNLDNLDRR
jgi:hypothetical protein